MSKEGMSQLAEELIKDPIQTRSSSQLHWNPEPLR